MNSLVTSLLDDFHRQVPIRTGSLIVSIFGDAIVARGGVLSLTSLLEITRGFRIADGLVRTALSRLVSDGWFERWKLGRNSFYRLTASGNAAFADATQRIYGGAPKAWSGAFDLVVLDGGDEVGLLRTRLLEDGYGALGQGSFLSIGTDETAENTSLLRLSAQPADLATARRLAERAWPLGDVELRYRQFLATYQHLPAPLSRRATIGKLDALVMRIVMIHDFRRAVLKDPLLPGELLPHAWPGTAARQLCAAIYASLVGPSEAWLDEFGQTDAGALPAPSADFGMRFALD